MKESPKDISKFYDEFSSQQSKTGVNIRHKTILRNLKQNGLCNNSNVLEIGCGIGTVTGLIGKVVTKGKVIAVDISVQSIGVARKNNKGKSNIQFLVSDMSDFKSEIKFDVVVLPDVLEHIPVDQHKALFKTIRGNTHDSSFVLINIPNPPYLRWLHRNKPELLQIIDQPLSTDELLNSVYPNDFYVYSLNTYSLAIEEGDYQSIILKRGRFFEFPSVTYKSKFFNAIQTIRSKLNLS